MAELGYDWVTLDDCFAMRRNSTTGELFPDPDKLFPVLPELPVLPSC